MFKGWLNHPPSPSQLAVATAIGVVYKRLSAADVRFAANDVRGAVVIHAYSTGTGGDLAEQNLGPATPRQADALLGQYKADISGAYGERIAGPAASGNQPAVDAASTDEGRREAEVADSCRRMQQYVLRQIEQSDHGDMIGRAIAEAEAAYQVHLAIDCSARALQG